MMRFVIFFAIVAALIWLWRSAKRPADIIRRDEAARLLGVAEDAKADEIIEAHKRLIAKVHPDAGGSADLAAQVNRARDVLLGTDQA